MIFGQNREELRRMYAEAWRRFRNAEMLSALDQQIAAVVADHPEYHDIVASEAVHTEWTPERGETNPFLHMGLHLALREQVDTDRPAGIRSVYDTVRDKCEDTHVAEHRMIDVLAECLWEAQSANRPPDENEYLERLRRL